MYNLTIYCMYTCQSRFWNAIARGFPLHHVHLSCPCARSGLSSSILVMQHVSDVECTWELTERRQNKRDGDNKCPEVARVQKKTAQLRDADEICWQLPFMVI